MNVIVRRIATALFVAALPLAPAHAAVAGIDGPWSLLVAGTTPAKVADGFYVPLIVSSIDGETPLTGTVAVKPGQKQILLDTPATTRNRAPSHKRMELDMAPCMRYFVAGKKSAEASLRWAPEVFLTEPIGECMAEFKLNAPAAGAR